MERRTKKELASAISWLQIENSGLKAQVESLKADQEAKTKAAIKDAISKLRTTTGQYGDTDCLYLDQALGAIAAVDTMEGEAND